MSGSYPVIQKFTAATPNAGDITTNTGSFNNNLGAGDVDVQTALDTIDDLAVSYSIKNIAVKTNDYTITGTDCTIEIDASSNTVTIDTPLAPATGQIFNVACSDSTFTATLDFNGKTFYGASTETLVAGENISIQYNGTTWIGA